MLEKQTFRNPPKTMFWEWFLFWSGGNCVVLECLKNKDSGTPQKQCFRNVLCSDLGEIVLFRNAWKTNIPEPPKNNVLGMIFVLIKGKLCCSRMLEKQTFRNPLKTMFWEWFVFWSRGNCDVPECLKNKHSGTPQKQCFGNDFCSDLGENVLFWNAWKTKIPEPPKTMF